HVVPGVCGALARILAGGTDHRLGDLADLLRQLQDAQQQLVGAVDRPVGVEPGAQLVDGLPQAGRRRHGRRRVIAHTASVAQGTDSAGGTVGYPPGPGVTPRTAPPARPPWPSAAAGPAPPRRPPWPPWSPRTPPAASSPG